MKTLIIKDLAVTAELDHKAMVAVRGGSGGASQSMYSTYCPPTGDLPYSPAPKSTFNFDASQLLGQSQNTQVNNGNNAAFVCGITSTVNPTQSGSNNINFGH